MPRVSDDMLKAVAPGVFYTDADIVAMDYSIVSRLKTEAMASPLRRARLCAHPSPDSHQQDMLIVSHRDTYVPPHRHLGKTETLLVLEGTADVLLFDASGAMTEVLPMGPQDSGRLFFCRMPEKQYHSLLIHDEWLIFLESTIGPFDPKMSENASWAPPPTAAEDGEVYKREMKRQMQLLQSA